MFRLKDAITQLDLDESDTVWVVSDNKKEPAGLVKVKALNKKALERECLEIKKLDGTYCFRTS